MIRIDPKFIHRTPRKFKDGRERKPYVAWTFLDGGRQYVGHFATIEEAERRLCLEYERHYWGDEDC